MSEARLVLGYEDFENALKNWQFLTNTVEPSTFGFYTTEFLPLFSSKTENAKKSCNLPNEEFIFLLYDKTFFGKCDFCTVVGRFGIYSSEEYKTHHYNGQKNNFVSWEKFLKSGLFSRHKERIFLDGEYVINGFTNSKKLFLLLNELRMYLSKCYPYYFITPCYTVPVGDIRLSNEELQSVTEKALTFLQKEKDKRCFFLKDQLQNDPVNVILSNCKTSEQDIFSLYKKDRHVCLITPCGIEAFEFNKKKRTTKKHTLTSWKELLRSQSLLGTQHKLFADGKYVCASNQTMFHLVKNLHILLGSKFVQKVTAPPTYDQIRGSLQGSDIPSSFKSFHVIAGQSVVKPERLSVTPPVARRSRKSSLGGVVLKEKEKKSFSKDTFGAKLESNIEESVPLDETEPEFSLSRSKGYELEPLMQVISFNTLCFVDPPPYPSD